MKAFRRTLLAAGVALMVAGKTHAYSTTPAVVSYMHHYFAGMSFGLKGISEVCNAGGQWLVPIGDPNYSHLVSLIEISFTTGRSLAVVSYGCDSSGNASTTDLDLR
jgi:hypothetical protein